jgi:hypothetical protein
MTLDRRGPWLYDDVSGVADTLSKAIGSTAFDTAIFKASADRWNALK